jgi:hypothetical protein
MMMVQDEGLTTKTITNNVVSNQQNTLHPSQQKFRSLLVRLLLSFHRVSDRLGHTTTNDSSAMSETERH